MCYLFDTTALESSMEIAELTGKRHDNVMRDIRAMLVELHGEGGLLSFEDTHTNPQNGQAYPVFQRCNNSQREMLTMPDVPGHDLLHCGAIQFPGFPQALSQVLDGRPDGWCPKELDGLGGTASHQR